MSNETGVVLDLPETIPGFESKLVEMSEKERDWLPDSTKYIKRRYFPAGADPDKVAIVTVQDAAHAGSSGREISNHCDPPRAASDLRATPISEKAMRSPSISW